MTCDEILTEDAGSRDEREVEAPLIGASGRRYITDIVGSGTR